MNDARPADGPADTGPAAASADNVHHRRPLVLAVVGHTNAGKTSLLRTLVRRREFGEVSDRPGTTRHAEAITLWVDEQPALRFVDTPGLEDPIGLLALLHGPRTASTDSSLGTAPGAHSPAERVRRFLASPPASAEFEQEAKVLRAAIDADALLHVIDCREPVLPKYRSEMAILGSCGRPVLPVLNFMHEGAARVAAWTTALADHGLHAVLRFDAVAPFVGAEQRLYEALKALVPAQAERFDEVLTFLALERLNRRAACLSVLADLLLAATALRETVPRRTMADSAARQAVVDTLHQALALRSRAAVLQWLDIHAFNADDAALVLAPWSDGRWQADLFNPEQLRRAGQALGTGAVVGAGIGLAADVALAGLSLGTGTAIGAALGGGLSQGFAAPGRQLMNLVSGRVELSIEDSALVLLAEQMLALLLRLERRGHGAVQRLHSEAAAPAGEVPAARALLAALRPARAHPEWAHAAGSPVTAERRGQQAAAATIAALRQRLHDTPADD